MTRIKLCGLKRACDIEWANSLLPEYIGFVFSKKSKRYVSPTDAAILKAALDRRIKAVGVFVDEPEENIATLLENGVIDIAQLHGNESEEYIEKLRSRTKKPIIKAFSIDSPDDVKRALKSSADMILFDRGSGGGGSSFDWSLIKDVKREYFLAGGLTLENVERAVSELMPYAVDVSSGIETDGVKDKNKMMGFVRKVRCGRERNDIND